MEIKPGRETEAERNPKGREREDGARRTETLLERMSPERKMEGGGIRKEREQGERRGGQGRAWEKEGADPGPSGRRL